MSTDTKYLLDSITYYDDFPIKGFKFRNIFGMLSDKKTFVVFNKLVDELIEKKLKNLKIDIVVGIESRGYIFGMMMSTKLNVPFVRVLKKGKLPDDKVFNETYDKNYGRDTLSMEIDDSLFGNALIVDDICGLSGSVVAAKKLCVKNKLNVVGAFVILSDPARYEQRTALLKDNGIDLFELLDSRNLN